MFRSHWRKVGFAIPFGLAIALALIASEVGRQRQTEDHRDAAKHRNEAAPEAAGRGNETLADASADVDPEPTQPEQREDAPQVLWDTPVQFLMMAFTFGGLALSLWAVLVVRGTLKAALAANQGFKRFSETQLRAYVVLEEMDFRRVAVDDVLKDAQFQPKWKNTGQYSGSPCADGRWRRNHFRR